MRKTVEWYRSNERWWKAVKGGRFRRYYAKMYGGRLESAGKAGRGAPRASRSGSGAGSKKAVRAARKGRK
jgi:hypothetical protein